MNIKDRKRINNLPKFDPGKIALNKGFLSPTNVDTSLFTSTPQYDMSNSISALKQSILPTTISNVTQAGSNIAGTLGNYTSLASAAKTNLSNYISKFGQEALDNGVKELTNVGLSEDAAITKVVEDGLKGSGQNIVKEGLSTTGKILSVAGTVYSGLNLANTIFNQPDSLNSSNMLAMSGKATQSKNGGTYDILTGFNLNQAMSYTKALTKSNLMNMLTNAVGFGANAGGLAGSFIPGIGTLVGTGLGAALGLVGGGLADLFGFGDNEEEVAERAKNVNRAITSTNTQSESVGSSRGMRDSFYSADKGKNSTYYGGKVGDIRMVHTSHGIVPGILFGLAGKGESIYNPQDGTASVYDEGKKRVDNIPTGVPLPGFNKGKEWDSTVIFGNMINPNTGNTFAKDAEPWSRILEENDNNMNLSKYTKLINRKNAQQHLNVLADLQMMVADKGKNKFVNGHNWTDAMQYLAPTIAKALPAIAYDRMANSGTPHAYNAFVSNPNSKAAFLEYDRYRYDPTPLYQQANKTARNIIYNTRQAGNLSSASKTNLINSALTNLYGLYANINMEANEKNAQRRIAKANAELQEGRDQATRMQSANTKQIEDYRLSVGTKQQLLAYGIKNWANLLNQASQDWSTNWFRRGLMNLYDKLVENDRIAALKGTVSDKSEPITSKNISYNIPTNSTINIPGTRFSVDYSKYPTWFLKGISNIYNPTVSKEYYDDPGYGDYVKAMDTRRSNYIIL